MATTSIVVKNVYNGGKAYFFDAMPLATLVAEFKQRLCDEVDEHPIPAQQRLIYSGKLCDDRQTLGNVLSKHDREAPHTFHLVLSGRHTSLTRTKSAPASSKSEGGGAVASRPPIPRPPPLIATAVGGAAAAESTEPNTPFTPTPPDSPSTDQVDSPLFRYPTRKAMSMPAGEAPSPPLMRTDPRAAAAAAAEARLAAAREQDRLEGRRGADAQQHTPRRHAVASAAAVHSAPPRVGLGAGGFGVRRHRSVSFEEQQQQLTPQQTQQTPRASSSVDWAEYNRLFAEALRTSSAASVAAYLSTQVVHHSLDQPSPTEASPSSSSSAASTPPSTASPSASLRIGTTDAASGAWHAQQVGPAAEGAKGAEQPERGHQKVEKDAKCAYEWDAYLALAKQAEQQYHYYPQSPHSSPPPPSFTRHHPYASPASAPDHRWTSEAAWRLSHFVTAQAALQQQCSSEYLERGYVGNVHDASLALASGTLFGRGAPFDATPTDPFSARFFGDRLSHPHADLGYRRPMVERLHEIQDKLKANLENTPTTGVSLEYARINELLVAASELEAASAAAAAAAAVQSAAAAVGPAGDVNTFGAILRRRRNAGGDAAGAAAAAAAGGRGAQAPDNQDANVNNNDPVAPQADNDDDGNNNNNDEMFGWFRMDDAKLALKLVAMVLLLGQDGDPFRVVMLSCAAVAYFAYHMFTTHVDNDGGGGGGGGGNDAWRHRWRRAGRGAAVGGNNNNNGGGGDGDDGASLMPPPLRARGLTEGGIAPGGGLVMDLTYLLLGFFCSLFPSWAPVPAIDPQLATAHQTHAAHAAQAAAAAAVRQQAQEQPPQGVNGGEQDMAGGATVVGGE